MGHEEAQSIESIASSLEVQDSISDQTAFFPTEWGYSCKMWPAEAKALEPTLFPHVVARKIVFVHQNSVAADRRSETNHFSFVDFTVDVDVSTHNETNPQ